MPRRQRRIRTVTLLGAGSIVLSGWLLSWAPVSLARDFQSVGACKVCESYTQGGETYWRCASVEKGAKDCTPSTSNCVESGLCPSSTTFLQAMSGH